MTGASDVDAYLSGVPDAPRAALEALRATIKAAAPDAVETISYQMPAFKLNGRLLVSYAAFTNHCSLFPASEQVIEAHGDSLAPYLAGKGTIRFTVSAPLSARLVRKIVKTRVQEVSALPPRSEKPNLG
jgi:uncharacterized protein YdhG (YjbR/CyaY superfamily)